MRATLVLTAAVLAFALLVPAHAQVEEDEPPPPLRTLSKTEASALEKQSDPRKRLELSLEFVEARLKAAEKSVSGGDFWRMQTEVGVMQGLIENTLAYLYRVNRGTNRDFENFKRFEIALRSLAPRLETIRREAPERFDRYLRSVAKQVRDARSKAVEPLFGNTVVPRTNENDDNQ